MIPLAAFEEVIDASGVAARIEAVLPAGVRGRQLSVRTLLAGMCLAQADHRPAHLTRVHQALTALSEDGQRRLGVTADWKHGPHLLTYRQTERTFGLIADALAEDEPGGLPSGPLQAACDDLLEASVPGQLKDASRSLAADWTDLESFSRPPPRGASDCADPEASWGHRKNNLLRSQDELFYGYYLSAGVMMPDENGPAIPETARRATLSSCRRDPVRAFAPVLTAMPGQGIPLGDILDDSGYAHRDAVAWAIPLRTAGAQLVQDLHRLDACVRLPLPAAARWCKALARLVADPVHRVDPDVLRPDPRQQLLQRALRVGVSRSAAPPPDTASSANCISSARTCGSRSRQRDRGWPLRRRPAPSTPSHRGRQPAVRGHGDPGQGVP